MEPDRIPVDYWADKVVTRKLMGKLNLSDQEELYRQLGIDFRFIEGTIYSGPQLPVYDDAWTDIWGVTRKQVFVDPANPEKGSYEHVVTHPLAGAETVKDIESYQSWPSADWYDYSQVENAADSYPLYCVVCGGDRLNRTAQLKPTMYLRGVEQTMLDLALNGNLIEAINEKLVAFFLEYNRRIFENAGGKIDIFFMGDDFGTQNGLIMSLQMWRKFYKPGFKKFIDLAHRFGIKVMHHTCGAVIGLIPDFIECGLDILQSLQPAAAGMDMQKIKKEYGGSICFQGGIDIQHTMPHGSPADVEKEVLDRIRTLSPGGGFILCTAHNMQADVPVENAMALFEAARKYGKY
ncbi:MAG: hypothetical protein C4530_09485 [Desulfobacteraceae bacterium]|nr:MAG: hypothetical protein C4530_09485 [Desulfobacteraceae bacterium]